MRQDTAGPRRREGPIALLMSKRGPWLGEPDEQDVGSVIIDIERERDLAIAIVCLQNKRTTEDIGYQVMARVIHREPTAYGHMSSHQQCRVCGCGDLRACWPPCWWVSEDLCSPCCEHGLDKMAENLEEEQKETRPYEAEGTFIDLCERGEAQPEDVGHTVAAWYHEVAVRRFTTLSG